MRLPTISCTVRGLLAIPFLAIVLALPASAETALNNTASSAEDATTNAAPAAKSDNPAAKSDNGAKPQTEINSSNAAPAAPGSGSQQDENKPAAAAEPAPEQPKSSILVDIDKSTQHMTVFVDGVEKYSWPVSTGMRGYSTPSGSYSVSSMNEMWYSKQWDDAPMPHAIFFTKKGHAIHGSYDVKRLGKPASHGCVRLEPKNATTLFNLVKASGSENVQIVLSGETPGGEAVVASQGGSQRAVRPPRAQYPPWFGGQAYADDVQPPPRRGFFGFGRRRQSQEGYYAPPRRGGFFQPRAYGY